MSVTNTKNNFLQRLTGKTNDKSILPAEQEYYNGMQQLPSYQGAKAQPAGQAPAPTGQPSAAAPQPDATQPAGTRYNLMQMLQPEPTRDVAGEELIKRRAKMNAIGRGFSALAGLGGMAVGGDAPAIADNQTPWNMDQLKTMDLDYRRNVQDWTDRRFQVDAMNNQTLNKEVDQQIDSENRFAQIDAQGQNAQMLAEQKANYALQQLQAKSQEEQIKEMQAMGINPNSENAYGEYLQKNREKFNSDLNYTRARTNWNNRPTGKAADSAGYDIETLTRGRDAMISQIEAEKAKALEGKNPMAADYKSISKQYDDRLKDAREYAPGKNPLMDAEIEKMGAPQDGETQKSAQDNEPNFKFDQEKGFVQKGAKQIGQAETTDYSKMPKEELQKIVVNLQKKVVDNKELLKTQDMNNPQFQDLATELVEQLVQMGAYPDEESAFEAILTVANN